MTGDAHLVQILLPLADNHGKAFPQRMIEDVSKDLSERFGGVTAYTRSPAEGRWQAGSREHHDDIMVIEVMAADIDRAWWRAFRQRLEAMFKQDQLVIRVQRVELI